MLHWELNLQHWLDPYFKRSQMVCREIWLYDRGMRVKTNHGTGGLEYGTDWTKRAGRLITASLSELRWKHSHQTRCCWNISCTDICRAKKTWQKKNRVRSADPQMALEKLLLLTIFLRCCMWNWSFSETALKETHDLNEEITPDDKLID